MWSGKCSLKCRVCRVECHYLTQPRQCDSQKTRNTTRLKCCACHAKWHWRSPKCCACHTKAFSTCLETCWNVTKCHACHAKWSYATLETSKSDPFCRTYHRHCHTALMPTVADGCGRLRTVEQRPANTAQPPDPQSETGTLRYAFGKIPKVGIPRLWGVKMVPWWVQTACDQLCWTGHSARKLMALSWDTSFWSSSWRKRKRNRPRTVFVQGLNECSKSNWCVVFFGGVLIVQRITWLFKWLPVSPRIPAMFG